MSSSSIRRLREVLLGVGNVIDIEIRNVDLDRRRISLGWVETEAR